jgi:hypothetical protein
LVKTIVAPLVVVQRKGVKKKKKNKKEGSLCGPDISLSSFNRLFMCNDDLYDEEKKNEGR